MVVVEIFLERHPSVPVAHFFFFLFQITIYIYINIYTGREVDYKETNQNEAYQLKRERERELKTNKPVVQDDGVIFFFLQSFCEHPISHRFNSLH